MQTTKSLKYWQWRTIVVTMIGYAMFYLVRKNFSFSMPGLGAEFGITKTQLGLFLTLHGVIYGLSRYVVGIITDRNSARKVMSLGLMLCAIVNILFGTSDAVAGWIVALAGKAGDMAAISAVLVYVMGILWMVNGFLQGMGVPPCTKTLTQWIHPKELATKMSIWNMSHSIGAGLAMALCGWIVMPHLGVDMSVNPETVAAITANLNLDMADPANVQKVTNFAAHFGAWRWCFLIPAGVAILGSVWLFFTMKDSPSDVGFPEVVGKKKAIVTTPEEAAEHRAFVNKHVYRNRIIWTLAITNFFVYVVRFAALDWGPTLLTESKGLSMANATTLCVVFELIGGNLGMLFWGWATDHIFKNKAHHTCVVCMVGVAICIALFWMLPQSAAWWVMLIPFTFLGFCIYGPQALLGICAAQHATNRASATANGILGIFGYLSTIVSGFGFGFVAQHYGWNAAYITIFVCAVIGLVTVLTIWGAKATGYTEEDLHQKA
ncbi:MAG: MFS transporter [Bacteroidales bacterium]|jgi:OPA family glycerol-3-phosphate transporter-like MFS transporter/OPA family sugar phosphate sensor protein UhpC-like MFS transporter|nr:MFS transporter [Bacteroidales bacterium]MBQ1656571.1 MFS transporter [Bacteroidales bacterium]MBQ1718384.1 MFS transporter [Bacteroidales bacterium]MBQ2107630.1 MFS transporter [Bacteroidales bacterium]MBQ2230174.1 MFS transporter [Bacteroidales bacterium]